MTAVLAPSLRFRAFTSDGLPLAFGKLYSYAAGTTTPQATYTDHTGDTANPNPTILDVTGQADIWLRGSYKFVLTNAVGDVQPGYPIDHVTDPFQLLRVTYAQLPSAAGDNGLYMVTDGLRGLYADMGAFWARVGIRVLDAAAYGFLPTNSAAANDAAMVAMLADLPASGGRIYLPWASTPYLYSTTIAPTKPLCLQGELAPRQGAAEVVLGSMLKFTGTGAAIAIEGAACNGSLLSNFGLCTSGGAGTVGIEVGNSANDVSIERVTIVSTVKFTVAGIRVGHAGNCHSLSLTDCYVRTCAPVGLILEEVNDTLRATNCRFKHHDTANVHVGVTDSLKTVQEATFIGCYFENGTGGEGVMINNWAVATTLLDHCHFEIADPNAVGRSGINIQTNGDVVIAACHIGATSATARPIVVNSAIARVFIEKGTFFSTSVPMGGHIFNLASQAVLIHNVHRAQTSTPLIAITGGSTIAKCTQQGIIEGADEFPQRGRLVKAYISHATTAGNVGAGLDVLDGATISANAIWRQHMGFKLRAWGHCAVEVSSHTKRVQVSIAGLVVWETGAVLADNTAWYVNVTGLRTAATNGISYSAEGRHGTAGATFQFSGATVLTNNGWDADVLIQVVGEATVTDEVQIYGLTVELLE